MLALLPLHRAGHDLSLKPKAARKLRQREVLAAKVDAIAALRKSVPKKGGSTSLLRLMHLTAALYRLIRQPW